MVGAEDSIILPSIVLLVIITVAAIVIYGIAHGLVKLIELIYHKIRTAYAARSTSP